MCTFIVSFYAGCKGNGVLFILSKHCGVKERRTVYKYFGFLSLPSVNRSSVHVRKLTLEIQSQGPSRLLSFLTRISQLYPFHLTKFRGQEIFARHVQD